MRVYGVVLAVLMAPAAGSTANCQILYGNLVGNVTDASQAAVPAARVTITNIDNNLERTTTASETGYFSFSNVVAGTYNVRVVKEGFREFLLDRVSVAINTVTRADVTLQVGVVAQAVEISGEALALQADRAEVRAEVNSETLVNVPVPPGRNYQQLFVTLPGVTPPEDGHSVAANPSRALSFNVNGVNGSTNNTRIDGASSTNLFLPHMVGYVPALEAIETVNVVTNSFDAEQGLAGGAAVNVQIKSGTNQVHGSTFWYHNDNRTKARPFFLAPSEGKPKYILNQTGATIGGPIRKNKLFYFVSYEATLRHQLGSGIASIPTVAMRNGDFSASPTAIYDTFSGMADGGNRTPFPGNRVPMSRVDPSVAKILPLWPTPNLNVAGDQNNHYVAQPFGFDRHTVDSKVNWNASPRLNVYTRVSVLAFTTDNTQWFGDKLGGPPIGGGAPGTASGQTYNTTVAGSYVVSPNLIVDAYFGYTRQEVLATQPRLNEKVGLDFLGIPGTNGKKWFEGGWPQFDIAGFTTIGDTTAFMPESYDDPQAQYAANASWTRGSHNVRLGADVYNQQLNDAQPQFVGAPYGASGGFSFAQGQTRLRSGPVGSEYNAFASFLLGAPSEFGRTAMIPDVLQTRSWLYSGYLQDRWQMSRKLTLSYGVRWEYLPITHRPDRGVEQYDWTNNKVLLCGMGSVPVDCGVSEGHRFLPRFGFAYRHTETFVIRGGYGITNDPFTMLNTLRGNYPLVIATDITAPAGFVPAGLLQQGIPEILPPDISSGAVPVDGRVLITSFMANNWRRPYIQSWNFTLQKQFRGGWMAQAGYVATRTINQFGTLDRNAGSPGGGDASRPLNQRFGRTSSTYQITGLGTFKYDSLQTRLERRFSRGYQLHLAYTFSKALGVSGVSNNSSVTPAINLPPYYSLNRSLVNYDRTHKFTSTAVAALPFGPGKKWARSGFSCFLLRGWQANMVTSLYSGQPFNVTAPGADLNAPGNTQRADLVKPSVEKLGGVGPGQKFYDTTAFAQVRAPRFGTAGFNLLRGPGCVNTDLSLFRRFVVSDRVSVQFRAEAFNATNTPKFANPNVNVGNTRFMEISATRGTGREGIDERTMRFGVRIGW